MKSINFKRSETTLRSIESSNRKVKRKINWDRIVYFLILFIFLFFLARYLINNYLYVEGNGQVLFDSVDIRNTDDCRVIHFFRDEGEEVEVGDSLFSYIPADENGNFSSPNTLDFSLNQTKVTQGDVSWAEREIYAVQEELKMTQIRIDNDMQQREILQQELDRIKNGVALDALPRFRLEDQYAKIHALDLSISSNQNKLAVLKKSLGTLYSMKRNLGSTANTKINKKGGNGGGGNGEEDDHDNIFYSPLAGTVTNLMKKEFEVALKSENILSIHKPENVYIKAFFNQEDLKSLKEGEIVTLTFPDGTQSEGIIKRFYFATYQLPEEFQKKYEPTTRSLSVDIYPVHPSDLLMWKTYWKMGVKITKLKY